MRPLLTLWTVCMIALAVTMMLAVYKPLVEQQVKAQVTLDPLAAYAIKLDQNNGTWRGNEVYKLCSLTTPSKINGNITVTHAVITKTKECPQ